MKGAKHLSSYNVTFRFIQSPPWIRSGLLLQTPSLFSPSPGFWSVLQKQVRHFRFLRVKPRPDEIAQNKTSLHLLILTFLYSISSALLYKESLRLILLSNHSSLRIEEEKTIAAQHFFENNTFLDRILREFIVANRYTEPSLQPGKIRPHSLVDGSIKCQKEHSANPALLTCRQTKKF